MAELGARRSLLALELTNVVQQTGRGPGVLQMKPEEPKKEEKAPEPKFSGCDKNQQDKITDAISQARGLAARALAAFNREYPLSFESTAMDPHFGRPLSSDQKSTTIARYQNVESSLASKNYKCENQQKKVKEGDKIVDVCAQASCPGNDVEVFPDFGKDICPVGPVLLHEAVHNAGGCDDIDSGTKHPPNDAENNAYFYEHFALAVQSGMKTPELGKRKPTAPPVK